MNKLDFRRFLTVNFAIILAGIIILFFLNINTLNWRSFFQGLGFFFLTIGSVELIYRYFSKNEEISNIEKIIDQYSKLMEIKFRNLLNLTDNGVIGLSPDLHYTEKFKNLENELLYVNLFFPDIVQIQEVLEQKILKGKVQKINFYLLDNRKGSPGVQLLKFRAHTFDKVEDFPRNVKTNIDSLCGLARRLLLNKHKLTEFNIYLCNKLPTLSLCKFDNDIAYVSFFFYNKRAINSTQLRVNMNAPSEFVNEIQCHLNFLQKSITEDSKKTNQKYEFNLLDETHINELEAIQRKV